MAYIAHTAPPRFFGFCVSTPLRDGTFHHLPPTSHRSMTNSPLECVIFDGSVRYQPSSFTTLPPTPTPLPFSRNLRHRPALRLSRFATRRAAPHSHSAQTPTFHLSSSDSHVGPSLR